MHRRPLPSILLIFVSAFAAVPLLASDSAATQPATQPALLTTSQLLALSPADAYRELLRLLAASKQRSAEHAAAALVKKYPRDMQLLFLHAVLTRSRFNIAPAAQIFYKIYDTDPNSLEGQCAFNMLNIDLHRKIDDNFAELAATAHDESDDPIITWLAAIACRTLDRNKEGIEFYRTLLKQWNPGPVLAHQTFANLLQAEEQYSEALIHRKWAVKLEPAGWSYQGLAITLASLDKRDEANAAFEKAAELQPEYLLTWWTWANNLRLWHDYQLSIDKAREALRIDPQCAIALNIWALDLQRLGKTDEAIAKFEETIKADPSYYYAFDNLADIYQARGDIPRAEALHRKAQIIKSGVH